MPLRREHCLGMAAPQRSRYGGCMDFPAFDFDTLGEADVREEIVAPLLRHLGYRSGTPDNVIREQHLTYPRLQLGRRKATDPLVRGKADYICDVRGHVRWVIEAKAPGEQLNATAEDQAWTYAAHPEVRAVFFVLTNGRQFKLFQTSKGPNGAALLETNYDQMRERLTAIEGLLTPDALLRHFPSQEVDTGTPIGPNLRSIVRITSGQVRVTELSPPIPALMQMIMTVTDGSVQRLEDGSLEAQLWTLVPFQSLQDLNEQLGLDRMRLISASTTVSTDPSDPTVFENTIRAVVPRGTAVLDLTNWKKAVVPLDVSVEAVTRASGYLTGRAFKGDYFGTISYLQLRVKVTMKGEFELQLA
jgi:hypothetical protein